MTLSDTEKDIAQCMQAAWGHIQRSIQHMTWALQETHRLDERWGEVYILEMLQAAQEIVSALERNTRTPAGILEYIPAQESADTSLTAHLTRAASSIDGMLIEIRSVQETLRHRMNEFCEMIIDRLEVKVRALEHSLGYAIHAAKQIAEQD